MPRWLVIITAFGLVACGGEAPTGDAGSDGDGAVILDSGRPDSGRPDSGPPPVECPDGCLVDGSCYPDGAPSPTNPCEVCDASVATDAFSPNDGARCDDGSFCTTDDVCSAGVCGGTYRDCDDGIACNGEESCDEAAGACAAGAPTCASGEICDALSSMCVLDCSGCLVDGVCYGDGQVDPLNPCRVCDPSASRSAWSDNDGARCDDGAFCTTGDVCAAGVCTGGAPRACDDGVACNGVETCDELASACVAGAGTCAADEVCDVGADACRATCTGCVIGGVCYGDGQRNPANQCQVCDPAIDGAAWSDDDGARCDDGLFCTTGDTCAAGTCGGAARDCGDGIACNGAETCDEASGACVAGAPTCGSGTLCEPATDSCVTTCAGCVIGGVCYGDGQLDPSNPCQVCDAAVSATAWTDNDGARCDDGLFCTDADTCSMGTCAGVARDCSDGVSCNGAETCDEAAGACTSGSSTCAAFEVCDVSSDRCEATCAGCVTGGVCYADGTANPANPCEVCDVARSRGAFSVNDGASCDDGLFCTTGDVCAGGTCAGTATNFCDDGVSCNGAETCSEGSDRCVAGATTCGAGEACDPSADVCRTTCSGCVIGGVCYAPATTDPMDPCQVCDPARSTSAWSINDGGRCDDGLFCTTGDVCDASGVCGGAARDCGDGVSCNGAETCNESSDRCDPGASACAAGTVCDTGADMCVLTCAGCAIGGACYAPGSVNPANPCEVCDTAASTSGWTANVGAACDDGQYCTTGEVCSPAGTCGGGAARDCGDGVACNGSETCNEMTDRCDAGTSTCGAGAVCDAASDMCVLSCGGGTTQCGASCVDTDNDPANCGGCGAACMGANATDVCVGGACRYLCDPGYGDCDAAVDGCETDLSSDAANCGACGNACSGGATCSGGACRSWSTSASPVAIPASNGCQLLWDSNADQIEVLDDGTVVVLLRCSGPGLAISVSTDSGRTFSSPRSVGVGLPIAGAVYASSASEVYVLYANGSTVYVRRTTTLGTSWDSVRGVGGPFSPSGPGPALDLEGRGGVLYATFGNGDSRSYVYSSTNGGNSWSSLPTHPIGGTNYCPDLGFDSGGALMYMNEPGHRLSRFSGTWMTAGSLGGDSYSDFAMGGTWAYGGGASPTVRRAAMAGGPVVSQSLTGGRGSMDADDSGDLYYSRQLGSTAVRLYRWVDGAPTVGMPIDVTVPGGSSISALAAPPNGDVSVTAVYSNTSQPIVVHVQAY
ncbi:MAG: hypothetical protein VYE22_14880 [Myxococcota bacterium]|nr:hypothetical protein [Myxococcota bacterium]